MPVCSFKCTSEVPTWHLYALLKSTGLGTRINSRHLFLDLSCRYWRPLKELWEIFDALGAFWVDFDKKKTQTIPPETSERPAHFVVFADEAVP